MDCRDLVDSVKSASINFHSSENKKGTLLFLTWMEVKAVHKNYGVGTLLFSMGAVSINTILILNGYNINACLVVIWYRVNAIPVFRG